MLEIAKLNQSYGESHILWDVAMSVKRGSCTCLMGRNGVGKTTLLKTVMGLLRVDSGSIRFDGEELVHRPAETRAKTGIGYVPQGREIFPDLTVHENLRIGLGRTAKARSSLERVLDLFPALKNMLRRRGGDLSGGQQQQLAIGRALVLSPKLLILDEPTEGIQPNIVAEIAELLRTLNKSGLTVLLVEQKLPFARKVADFFHIAERGRIVVSGPMTELTDDIVQRHLSV